MKDMTISSLTADEWADGEINLSSKEADGTGIKNLTTNRKRWHQRVLMAIQKASPMHIPFTYRNASCSQGMRQPMNTVGWGVRPNDKTKLLHGAVSHQLSTQQEQNMTYPKKWRFQLRWFEHRQREDHAMSFTLDLPHRSRRLHSKDLDPAC